MKTLIMILFFLPSLGQAKTIIIHPGRSQDITMRDFRGVQNQTLVVNCEPELECRIDYDYVGKYFRLKMPNGKVYKKFKKEESAISGSGTLIQSKICDRLVLDVDKERPIVAN